MGSIPFERTLNLFKYLFSYVSQTYSKSHELLISPLRLSRVYSKSKHIKVRLFCKNIVLFTVALDIIVTSELHFLYYGITISMETIQPLLICLTSVWVLRSLYFGLFKDASIVAWLKWLYTRF